MLPNHLNNTSFVLICSVFLAGMQEHLWRLFFLNFKQIILLRLIIIIIIIIIILIIIIIIIIKDFTLSNDVDLK